MAGRRLHINPWFLVSSVRRSPARERFPIAALFNVGFPADHTWKIRKSHTVKRSRSNTLP